MRVDRLSSFLSTESVFLPPRARSGRPVDAVPGITSEDGASHDQWQLYKDYKAMVYRRPRVQSELPSNLPQRVAIQPRVNLGLLPQGTDFSTLLAGRNFKAPVTPRAPQTPASDSKQSLESIVRGLRLFGSRA